MCTRAAAQSDGPADSCSRSERDGIAVGRAAASPFPIRTAQLEMEASERARRRQRRLHFEDFLDHHLPTLAVEARVGGHLDTKVLT